MATREVVVSVCDRCTAEVSTPLNRKNKRHELVLPQGWLHVAGNTTTALVFEMDLCTDCKKIVVEAAGMARQVYSTTGTAKDKTKDKTKDKAEPTESKADPAQEDKVLLGAN